MRSIRLTGRLHINRGISPASNLSFRKHALKKGRTSSIHAVQLYQELSQKVAPSDLDYIKAHGDLVLSLFFPTQAFTEHKVELFSYYHPKQRKRSEITHFAANHVDERRRRSGRWILEVCVDWHFFPVIFSPSAYIPIRSFWVHDGKDEVSIAMCLKEYFKSKKNEVLVFDPGPPKHFRVVT